MDDINQMMALFMAAIGGYAIYAAITGKGSVYKNDYPKAMKEEANQMMRKFCWIYGPIALITGVLDYLGYSWAYWVSLGTTIPGIVIYTIIFKRKFKDYFKKK